MKSARISRFGWVTLIGILCAVTILGSCSRTAVKANRGNVSNRPLKVAFNTWMGYSSFYIAQMKGIFERLGIDVEVSVIDPLAEKNAALLRGDLDAMGGTIDSTVISAASGVKGKVVFMFDRSNGTDGIVVSDKIKSVEDLKNVKVAVEEGFVGHFFLLYYLDKHGISPKEISIIPMTTDAAGAAFVAGKVDAAVTWEPYLTEASKRPGARILVSSAQLEPILADTLFVSDRVLKTRRDDIQRLVAGLQEANEYWLAHPAEVATMVAPRWNLTAEDFTEIMKTVEIYDLADQRRHFGQQDKDGELYRFIQKAAELWYRAGVVDKLVDAAALIDGAFVRALPRYETAGGGDGEKE